MHGAVKTQRSQQQQQQQLEQYAGQRSACMHSFEHVLCLHVNNIEVGPVTVGHVT